jgi:hypothetical protein
VPVRFSTRVGLRALTGGRRRTEAAFAKALRVGLGRAAVGVAAAGYSQSMALR